MELIVLVDNNTYIDRYFFGEPGVSFYIEERDCKILFDVGYSDIFMKNAEKMNVDLKNLDLIVVSHGHIDHTRGFGPLINMYTELKVEGIEHNIPQIIAHPDAFNHKVFGDGMDIGSIIDGELLKRHFPYNLTKKPFFITDKLVFLGEIERTNEFENKEAIGSCNCDGHYVDDYLLDDTALVYKSKDGLVIITGCSHAGICNIIEYAKKICGDSRIADVIGGFHLLEPSDEQMNGTIDYFNNLDVKKIHACHCTDLYSKIKLSKVVDLAEVGVGLSLKFD